MMPESELVKFDHELVWPEAGFFAGALEAEGIPAVLSTNDLPVVSGFVNQLDVLPRLMIRRGDLPRARELYASFQQSYTPTVDKPARRSRAARFGRIAALVFTVFMTGQVLDDGFRTIISGMNRAMPCARFASAPVPVCGCFSGTEFSCVSHVWFVVHPLNKPGRVFRMLRNLD